MDSNETQGELLGRIEALTLRISILEHSLEEMSQRFDNLVASISQKRPAPSTEPLPAGSPAMNGSGPEHAHEAAEIGEKPRPRMITPGLAAVIRLIALGQGEDAHRAMRELPAEELSEQPAVVTLAVAALCVQKGDYAAGLKALERARNMTDDPRLLRVIQAVEAQLA